MPDGIHIQQIFMWLATWGGSGLVEPLRAGLAVFTIVGVALFFPKLGRPHWSWALLIVTLAGWWAAERWAAESGLADDRRIVIDEVAGFLAVLAVAGVKGWLIGSSALLFLALDRLKPWPFSRLEDFGGGFGVMLDDVMLGIVLGGVIFAARWLASSSRKTAHPPD